MNEKTKNAIDELVAQLDRAVKSFLEDGPTAKGESIASLSQEVLLLDEVSFDLGATAMSLLSFFKNASDITLSPGDHDQVRLMWLSLRNRLLGRDDLSAEMPDLVAPIAHSGLARRNRTVSLMVESRTIQALLQSALAEAGYELVPLDSLKSLAGLAPESLPVAIIADLSLCRQESEAAQILSQARQASGNSVHLFCLSAADDFAARLDAVRLGATRFLKKPVDVNKLLAILNGVTARIPTEPFRVLFVDDDRSQTLLYRAMMTKVGFAAEICNNALQAPEMVAAFHPDVIVTDVYMPGCNGLELAALLRQDEDLVDTPILFLSSESNINRQMAALGLGADDFLTKPVSPEVLTSAVIARARRSRMLKRVRHELDRARFAAEQASRAKSRFMADMNHELKVPLNAMLGYAQLMEMEIQSPCLEGEAHRENLLQSVARICEAGEDQGKLICEILELSKAEAGRLDIAVENVELSPLVAQCLDLLMPEAEKRQIRCDNQVPSNIRVQADPQRLKQVLLNLLSNAIKYNREQGRITVTCHGTTEDGVQVVVKDTGLGMPQETLRALFQPFSRLHLAHHDQVEGTGLGLAMVKSLVEAMGGQVGVSSEEGVGSEFWFSLSSAAA